LVPVGQDIPALSGQRRFTAESRQMLEKAAAAGQVVPETALRTLFAMLRRTTWATIT
jgi:hypothetical protein